MSETLYMRISQRERERESYSLHKEPFGRISTHPQPPVPNPIFGPQCQAESGGVINNLDPGGDHY